MVAQERNSMGGNMSRVELEKYGVAVLAFTR
jgi:hypothetical protein